jgi:hypothetical protein
LRSASSTRRRFVPSARSPSATFFAGFASICLCAHVFVVEELDLRFMILCLGCNLSYDLSWKNQIYDLWFRALGVISATIRVLMRDVVGSMHQYCSVLSLSPLLLV